MDALTDPMIASQMGRLERRIAKLKAELHGTVTTKYHDKIVNEAVLRAQKAEAERDRLRDHIYQHRAQFTKSTPVRAVDLELWAALEGE